MELGLLKIREFRRRCDYVNELNYPEFIVTRPQFKENELFSSPRNKFRILIPRVGLSRMNFNIGSYFKDMGLFLKELPQMPEKSGVCFHKE